MIDFLVFFKKNRFSTIKINNNIVCQVINSIMLNSRKVISKQKTRGEVNFSNKKPWKQKGTGSARAGRKSSPLWIKGGRSFSNKNNVYKNKINKKVFRKFRFMVMIFIFKKKNIFHLHEIKNLKDKIKEGKFLIILDKKEDFLLFKSFKNFKNVYISNFENINTLDLIKYNNIIIKEIYLKKMFYENTKYFEGFI